MKHIISKGHLSILIVVAILILDQVVKVLVKTKMYYGESIHITDWFYIHFIENNGMAFGIKIMPKVIQTKDLNKSLIIISNSNTPDQESFQQ